jgi:hypothetical protein
MSLSPKGVLEYTEEDSSEYCCDGTEPASLGAAVLVPALARTLYLLATSPTAILPLLQLRILVLCNPQPMEYLHIFPVPCRHNCDKSKDVFFGISTNSWLFWVLISDSESPEREDSEYIGISYVGWLWEKKESFFFFSAGVEIEGFWDKEDESERSKKMESFRFNLLRSYWICRAIASEDKDI